MRSKDIYQDIHHTMIMRTDQFFSKLMLLQWLGCLTIAWHLDPTWHNYDQNIYSPFILTIFSGGLISAVPLVWAKLRPGHSDTQHIIAISQMLMSSFFVYITNHHTGSLFHAFGSLAFVAFYRDPNVILSATTVAIAGAFFCDQALMPQDVRWHEFSCWLLFEDIFLIYLCIQSRKEQLSIALHQSELESFAHKVEKEVQLRMHELKEVNNYLKAERARNIESSKLAALGEMAANIAHEINSPLTAIELNAMELMEVCSEPQIDSHNCILLSRDINASANRIAKIVQSLKSFAREDDQEPFRHASVEDIINQTVILCAAKFTQHQVLLHVNPSPHLLLIKCRPVQISQVLMNLLQNALDAVEGQPNAWVEVSWHGGKNVSITVTDSGPGVPHELHEKIFNPFFTTKAVGKGTGIGLNLSKKIIDKHGGKLICSPIPGLSKFTIELPEDFHEYESTTTYSSR